MHQNALYLRLNAPGEYDCTTNRLTMCLSFMQESDLVDHYAVFA